ncbi:barstar family protein [Alienimonas chondri]|uniref:barstar family protein n=1 Tax=Alienimonas chondri TaxID=2681879 RepID=UPI0019D65731|nr:barstar family protein [Alienimonas chondri]
MPPGDGTKAGFLRSFAEAIDLPGLHALNWDAFADAFSAFVADADRPLILRHDALPRLRAEGDLGVYVDVLSDVANRSDGRLKIEFPDDATPPPADRTPPAAAIAHYHLNRGGVTRVVANHLLALRANQINPPWAVLLTGGRAEAWDEHEHTLEHEGVRAPRPVVAGLDYDDLNPGDGSPEPDRLADRIETALADHQATRDETVLHIHNHALGKNVSLPGAVALLAERGWKLLLQLHDFAEEFRPANYLHLVGALGEDAVLYPQASQIHYAVLNGRDRGVLRSLGVPEERLHFLPNPVGDFPPLPDRQEARSALRATLGVCDDEGYLVYPVRGIRRKNLGETILLTMGHPDQRAGVTLIPRNPAELAYHDRWKAFAEELDLPVLFGVGEEDGLSFHQNLAAADAILTTSVAEGFGMVFLEAWLAGRPLMGRDLPHVTADFKAEGLELPGLYEALTVPLDWAIAEDGTGFEERFRAGCERLLKDYRRPWNESAFAEALAAKTDGGRIDFADLDEELQFAVIRRIADDPAARGEVRSIETDPGRPTDGIVQANAAVVRDRYSLAGSGERLRAVYDAVLASPVGPVTGPPHPRAALDAFLDLKTFRLIRG